MWDWLNDFSAITITVIIFVIGFIGGILPIIPGTIVIWAGILLHRLWMGDASVSWNFVWIAFGLMLVSQIVDYVLTLWGAKVFGATWRGVVGAIVGGILGMIFFNFIGMLIGPVIGAVVGELLGRRKFAEAQKAGVGTIIGGLAAFVTKQVLAFIMILGFFFSLPPS